MSQRTSYNGQRASQNSLSTVGGIFDWQLVELEKLSGAKTNEVKLQLITDCQISGERS